MQLKEIIRMLLIYLKEKENQVINLINYKINLQKKEYL